MANKSREDEHTLSSHREGQMQPCPHWKGPGRQEAPRLLPCSSCTRCARFSPRPRIIIIYSFRDLEIPLPYQKNNESPSEKWALQKGGKKKKKKTKKNIKITQPPMLLVLGQMGELI